MGAIEFVGGSGKEDPSRCEPQNVREMRQSSARPRFIAGATPHGDILGFVRPLVTTKGEADEIVAIAKRAVRSVTDALRLSEQIVSWRGSESKLGRPGMRCGKVIIRLGLALSLWTRTKRLCTII